MKKKSGIPVKDRPTRKDIERLNTFLKLKIPDDDFARTLLMKALVEYLEMNKKEEKEKSKSYNPSQR